MKKKIEKFLLDKYGIPDKAHASAVDGKYPFGKSCVYSVCMSGSDVYSVYTCLV